MNKTIKLNKIDTKILDYLQVHDHLKMQEAISEFNVSRMTIYRSFKKLEEESYLDVHRGHATIKMDKIEELDYNSKRELHAILKDRIAKWTVENLIPEHATLSLEAGTSISATVKYLSNLSPMTLLTNGINVQVQAAEYLPNTEVMSCGGILRKQSLSYIGSTASRFFESHYADIFLMGCPGIHIDLGITEHNKFIVDVKRSMMRNAGKTILLADSGKFENRALIKACDISDVDIIVTDNNLKAEIHEKFSGTEIILV